MSWVSFEMPLTGLRSVSPSARTPITLSSRARSKARRVRPMEIMPANEDWTAKMQKGMVRMTPMRVDLVLIWCSAGASCSSRSSKGPEDIVFVNGSEAERLTGLYPLVRGLVKWDSEPARPFSRNVRTAMAP